MNPRVSPPFASPLVPDPGVAGWQNHRYSLALGTGRMQTRYYQDGRAIPAANSNRRVFRKAFGEGGRGATARAAERGRGRGDDRGRCSPASSPPASPQRPAEPSSPTGRKRFPQRRAIWPGPHRRPPGSVPSRVRVPPLCPTRLSRAGDAGSRPPPPRSAPAFRTSRRRRSPA